ncbi:hypothetical protein [Chryseobacterium indoltheticum]|uniref:hypothetical protein n=1 Tax=Chryseobacterium indoltheticum TaxID=254 RepID=UPI003F491C3C
MKKNINDSVKYEIDLFKNEKRDTAQAYIMSEDEAYGISDMVVASSDISVTDSSSGRGKSNLYLQYQFGRLVIQQKRFCNFVSLSVSFDSEIKS